MASADIHLTPVQAKLLVKIAWSAGLFEGEGSFHAFKSKHAPRKSDGGISYVIYPRAEIMMTDKDVLDRFASIVGTGKVNGPYYDKRGHRKPKYSWAVTNTEAIMVMKILGPFMCSRRVKQIEDTLSKCGRFDTRNGANVAA